MPQFFSAKSKGITNLLLDNPPIRRCWQLKQPLSVALHVSKHLYQILEVARRNKNSWRRSNGNCEPCRHRRNLCKWHSTMGPRSTPCLKRCWETSRRGWKAAGVRNFCEKIQAFHRISTSKKLICSLIWVVFVAYWYQNLFRPNQGISSCQSLREPLPHCQVQQAMPRNCTTNCSQKATIWKTQRRLASRQWGSRFLKMIVFRQWLCTCFGMGQRVFEYFESSHLQTEQIRLEFSFIHIHPYSSILGAHWLGVMEL